MSRWEFMRQLEKLLSGISPNEREEALQYYNDYFNDAGRENEQSVIDALGSPEQVAKIVKDGLTESGSQGEFTENGFLSGTAEEKRNALVKKETNRSHDSNADNHDTSAFGASDGFAGKTQDDFGIGRESQSYQENYEFQKDDSTEAGWKNEKKEGMPTWGIVLIVIACIVVSPVIIGIAGSLLGTIVGLAGAVIGITVGFGAAAVILFIVAVALVAAGIGNIFTAPFSAIGLIGGGCICAAIGILFLLAVVFIVGKCIPAICHGIVYIFKSIFRKKEETWA